MNTALTDFLTTVTALEAVATKLEAAASPSESGYRSSNALQLNGLQVIAFAAVEDFLRRRTFEVISSLGKENFKFNELPPNLKLFILEGTVAGLSFVLNKTDSEDRLTLLQLEGLLLGSTSDDNEPFSPSEYFFGRSQSNLSTSNVKLLLEALNIAGGWTCVADIADMVGYQHLGPPSQIFTRMATNRHRAAHAFGGDYKVEDFVKQMQSGARILAFGFDTCINQAVFQLKKAKLNNVQYETFNSSNAVLRILSFNTKTNNWEVIRGGRVAKKLVKGQKEKYIGDFTASCKLNGESMLVVNNKGQPETWIQPID